MNSLNMVDNDINDCLLQSLEISILFMKVNEVLNWLSILIFTDPVGVGINFKMKFGTLYCFVTSKR